MSHLVWVASWEVQCCGQPFAVGGTVTWAVAGAGDEDHLDLAVDETARPRPQYIYSRHGGGPETDDSYILIGEVVSISAVHQDMYHKVKPDGQDSFWGPIPGSDRLTAVESDHMWELEPPEGEARSFAGWIVEVDVTDVAPAAVRDNDTQREFRPKVVDDVVRWIRQKRHPDR